MTNFVPCGGLGIGMPLSREFVQISGESLLLGKENLEVLVQIRQDHAGLELLDCRGHDMAGGELLRRGVRSGRFRCRGRGGGRPLSAGHHGSE